MAREHARIWVSIWEDQDFLDLEPIEQWVYFALCSNKDLSYCGVVDYVPERFMRLAKGLTKRRFTAALAVLRDANFVVVDERTVELLVRSYVRHDGILKVPNVAKAMVRALYRTHSRQLRDVVVAELVRARIEEPDAAGWRGVKSESEALFVDICAKASANGFGNPSANPFGKGEVNA